MNNFQMVLAKVKAFFTSVFTKMESLPQVASLPQVEHIVADLRSTISKLEGAAVAHTEAAAKHAAAIVVAETKKLESEVQTKLANSIADNIRSLLTPKA